MNSVSVKDICESTKGSLLYNEAFFSRETAEGLIVDSVIIDSRQGAENTLFVPFIGERHDAHDFIPDVYRLGTRVCFTSRNRMETGTDEMVYICVEDTLEALQRLGTAFRKRYRGKVIGITGSVGKTTTKEMVALAMSEKAKVLKTFGNRNGQIGVPLMMLELDDSYDVAVIEMGMSLPGEMKKLAQIALPDMAVMTNIGVAHIGQLGSQENILKEKLNICSCFAKDGGVLLVNGEDEWLNRVEEYLPDKHQIKVVRFGLSERADYYADAIQRFERHTEFMFCEKAGDDKVSVNLAALGMHNVIDAVSALAVAKEAGKDVASAEKQLATYEPMASRGRLEQVGELMLIDDTYNASPDSMRSGLDTVESLKANGRKIVVLADILELGELSETCHREVGAYAAGKMIDCLITIGTEARFIAEQAERVFNEAGVTTGNSVGNNSQKKSRMQICTCESREEAFSLWLSDLQAGDVVYMKGSHGMRLDLLAQQLREKYSGSQQ